MAFGVIAVPGGGQNESPQRVVDGFTVFLAGPTVSGTVTPDPGIAWDAFTMTNFSSDWVRFTVNGPDIQGNNVGLLSPGGGVVALSFGDGGNNPITSLDIAVVDITAAAPGVSPVSALPTLIAASGDGIISVILQEK